MAVNLIKTGGTNANVNKNFEAYRQGKPPLAPKCEMPKPTTKNGRLPERG